MKKFLIIIPLIGLITVILLPLGSFADDKLTIYSVNYPLKYFAERIAGERADVVFPAPSEGDPAYWIPDTQTIIDYQKADLILLNGANYAKWVRKVSLPRSKMLDTSGQFKDRYITAEEVLTHSHGSEGEHAHESLAFTVWLDLSLAAQQAKAITNAISRKRPSYKEEFQKNYFTLEKELLVFDMEIKATVKENQSQPLVASHPVYDYFARAYSLNLKSVHWEPDEVPSSEQMLELKALLKEHPAKWLIWEGEPIKESVEGLKSIGMNSLVFDPCGNVPEKGDFFSVMKENVKNLRLAFE